MQPEACRGRAGASERAAGPSGRSGGRRAELPPAAAPRSRALGSLVPPGRRSTRKGGPEPAASVRRSRKERKPGRVKGRGAALPPSASRSPCPRSPHPPGAGRGGAGPSRAGTGRGTRLRRGWGRCLPRRLLARQPRTSGRRRRRRAGGGSAAFLQRGLRCRASCWGDGIFSFRRYFSTAERGLFAKSRRKSLLRLLCRHSRPGGLADLLSQRAPQAPAGTRRLRPPGPGPGPGPAGRAGRAVNGAALRPGPGARGPGPALTLAGPAPCLSVGPVC